MRTARAFVSSFVLASLIAACGGNAPPQVPTASKHAPPAPPAIDTSPVPDPEGLLVLGRVNKPEAILKTVGGWVHFPVPGVADLARSMADDAVADAIDPAQPIDGAVVLAGGKRDPEPLAAVSVAVRSYEEAKAKLSAHHKATAGENGQVWFSGIAGGGAADAARGARKDGRGGDEDEDEQSDDGCVLGPTPGSGGRLVCGENAALKALGPYLTRTVPKKAFASDVHLAVYPGPTRDVVAQMKASVPFLARGLLGSSSPALRELFEAGAGEVSDFVNDTRLVTLDAQIADDGVTATVKVHYQSTQSLVAKLATTNAARADVPPAAFWHLPADTDVAFFTRGSDPKLLERPRALVGNVALEAAQDNGMPEPERSTVKDLLAERVLPLFGGPLVYGKGFDPQAVEVAENALRAVKPDDVAGVDEAEKKLGEQLLGWHLVQVAEPIAKVGPILKDWAQLWNRPAFTKWAKQVATQKMIAQVRVAASPAGVALPKDAVHLEIVIPREDLVLPAAPTPLAPAGPTPGKKPPAPKTIKRSPVTFHVLAVPDQGATWIGFGLAPKLLAQHAAAALASAPEKDTLGQSANAVSLKDAKTSGAWLLTLKGLLVFTAKGRGSPFAALGSTSDRGSAPIVLAFTPEAPSADAPAGASVSTVKLPRAAIEDIVKVAMATR